jgi:SAM-dependent methyltransferase
MADSSSQPQPQAIPPRFQVSRMISSLWVPQAIYAAAKLGLPDVLAEGPASGAEVAAKAGTHPEATFRLLRSLVVLDLLRQHDDGRFELTETGRCLTRDAPDSVRSWALLWGGPMMWPCWGHLADCVARGEMAPKILHGFDSPFELMEKHPEEDAHFNRSMAELTRGVAMVLPAFYDFADAKLVCDVGGGFGQLLVPLLKANPETRGQVYDLARCADGSRALMAEEGLAERGTFQAGDFFESVPEGADVYLIKSVIHDWNDEKSRQILSSIRRAMKPGAKLLLLEWIVPERVGPADAGIIGTDLNMLVMVGGQERTEPEYRELVASAGLRVERIIPTPAAMSLIECVVA